MGDLAILWPRRMIVAVVVAVVCGCASKQHAGESPREADRSNTPQNALSHAGLAIEGIPTSVARAMTPEERHQKVAALIASGTPTDAFEAARIIGPCKRVRHEEADRAAATGDSRAPYELMPTVEQACAGLDASQEAAYADLIIQSVGAGVPNAFAYVFMTASNDDEVESRYHQLMQAAVDAGDPGAMWTRAMMLSMPLTCGQKDERCSARELAEALELLEAAKQIVGRWPPPGRSDPIPPLVDRLDRKEAGLSGAAIERGKALGTKSNGRRSGNLAPPRTP